MNLFKRYRDRSPIKRITLTGVFLGLVILFQYLESYMPYGDTFIKFNFSLLFILPIFYFAGPIYGFLTIILRFVIGITMKGGWGNLPQITAHFILMISTLVAIGYMYLYSIVFNKIENHNKKIIYISIATVLSASLTLTLLNGVWFTPMFLSSYKQTWAHMFDIDSAIKQYDSWMYTFHFGIRNYWAGIFAVYFSGNLIKFGMIYIVNYPLSKVIRHYY